MAIIPLFLNMHRSVVPLRHNYIIMADAVRRYLKCLHLSVNFSTDITSREVAALAVYTLQWNYWIMTGSLILSSSLFHM